MYKVKQTSEDTFSIYNEKECVAKNLIFEDIKLSKLNDIISDYE